VDLSRLPAAHADLVLRPVRGGARLAARPDAAIGPVYGSRGALRVVQATVLATAVAAIELGYRFALLLITLHST
jgi:hypothetical protein